MTGGNSIELIVTDIDNTVFDWVNYYVNAFTAMLDVVGNIIGVDPSLLAEQSKEIFSKHGSIEYPFLVQELPAVNDFYSTNIEGMLEYAVRPGREAFNKAAAPFLMPYHDVVETLGELRRRKPRIKIAALTDAPRYVAMWKLNKLGILPFFDAVYGLRDPKIPWCQLTHKPKVDNEIVQKHLQQNDFGFRGHIRTLPEDYEKPGTRGLKTVLMDFEKDDPLENRRSVLWVGDNLRKDVGLGNKLGVRSAWAEYGTKLGVGMLDRLATFSPAENVHRNVYIPMDHPDAPKPDVCFGTFSDLLRELS